MEEQMSGFHSHIRRWLILSSILMLMLACNFLSGSGVSTPTQAPIGEATRSIPVGQKSTKETDQSIPNGPDPLDRLLELRSVQFQLTALQPDGSTRSLQGEIDRVGSMHLKFFSPVPALSDLPEGFDPDLKLPEEYEVYVVDGKSYQPDDSNPAWMTMPVSNDTMKELSNLLHGPDGPGLWLDFLPAGSLNPAGQETVGGFAADKYTVQGLVHDQAITGALWYASHVLVRVELHIPAALSDPNQTEAKGELEITLEVQKTDVPSVVVPPAGPTSQP